MTKHLTVSLGVYNYDRLAPCDLLRRFRTNGDTKYFAGFSNMEIYPLCQPDPKQKLLIQLLLENDILRLSWLPTNKISVCNLGCPESLVDYVECERTQLGEAVRQKRHIKACIGRH
jgi:hypothetical protein